MDRKYDNIYHNLSYERVDNRRIQPERLFPARQSGTIKCSNEFIVKVVNNNWTRPYVK